MSTQETMYRAAANDAFWTAMAAATSAQKLYEVTPEEVERYVFDQRTYYAPKNRNTVWDDVRTPKEFIELAKQGLRRLKGCETLFPVNRMTADQKWVMKLLGVSADDLVDLVEAKESPSQEAQKDLQCIDTEISRLEAIHQAKAKTHEQDQSRVVELQSTIKESQKELRRTKRRLTQTDGERGSITIELDGLHQTRRSLQSIINRGKDDITLDGSSFFRDQQGATLIARAVEALEAHARKEWVAVVPQIANCELPYHFYAFLSGTRIRRSIFFIHDKRFFGLLDSQLSLEQLQEKEWEESEPYIEEVLWEITPDACKEAIAKLYEKVHRVEPTKGEVLLPLTGDGSWLLDKILEEEFVETLSEGALSVEGEKDTLEAILKHFKRILAKESPSKRQKLPAENDK